MHCFINNSLDWLFFNHTIQKNAYPVTKKLTWIIQLVIIFS